MNTDKKIRCAIYTRKSSEEGLEMDFNSLHAQREACEAYIKSQKHEGWALVNKEYNDGGFSGGTLERPALKELLKDISNGLVDIIVVYKIDRLTRSLMDFSKIVEVLDKNNTSFVSITQQFNTTTSMGRLTLNMLLSFAQFEREVTGERIRDKYAASKKKGMWMGGVAPIGYERKDKKLYPVPSEVELVKTIFNKYIELRSVGRLKEFLDLNKIFSRTGKPLSKGNLHHILVNRVYVGEVGHKGIWYRGEHQGIIQPEIFKTVQNIINNNQKERENINAQSSLLSGKIFDDKGNHMSPSHSLGRHGKKYRYYLSQAVIRKDQSKLGKITKISAPQLEEFIQTELKGFMEDPKQIQPLVDNVPVAEQKKAIKRAEEKLLDKATIRSIINKVEVKVESVKITLYKTILENILLDKQIAPTETTITFEKPYSVVIIDNGAKIILGEQKAKQQMANTTLIKVILAAHRWSKILLEGILTAEDIAKKENVTKRYVYRILNLAFISPKLTQAILTGTQPADLTLSKLESFDPLDWPKQESTLA